MVIAKAPFYLIWSLWMVGIPFHEKSQTADSSFQNTVFKDVSEANLQSKGLNANTMDGEAYDIDSDGDMDMILAMEFTRNIVLINDGTGVLSDESSRRFPNAVHDSEDIAIADFDGDGDPDIIFVSEDDEINEYYRNNGKGFFSDASSLIKVKGTSNVVETADLNNDGFPDLIIGNRGQNFLLINNGKSRFTDESAARLPENTYITQDIVLEDIDGDGDPDLIEANETFNRILINNGNGKFTDESEKRLPPVNDQTREVALADIDRDGDPDIFFANVDFGGFGDPQNRILLNDGKGYYTEITGTALPKSNFRTVGARFFDMNNDGYPDIISGNRFNGLEKIVLINDRKNHFHDRTAAYFPELNSYPFNFEFADFDADGLQDIYMCNFRGADILLLRSKR